MQTDSSAMPTCLRLRSTVECTATVLMPSVAQARRMRSAISPRLAMTTLSSIGKPGFGIGDWGFGRAGLVDALFQRVDQCVQSGKGLVHNFTKFGCWRCKSQSHCDLDLRVELG